MRAVEDWSSYSDPQLWGLSSETRPHLRDGKMLVQSAAAMPANWMARFGLAKLRSTDRFDKAFKQLQAALECERTDEDAPNAGIAGSCVLTTEPVCGGGVCSVGGEQ
jgi:hypothetical protein